MTNNNTKEWETQLLDIEENFPMALESWGTEDWKNYIRKGLIPRSEIRRVIEAMRNQYSLEEDREVFNDLLDTLELNNPTKD